MQEIARCGSYRLLENQHWLLFAQSRQSGGLLFWGGGFLAFVATFHAFFLALAAMYGKVHPVVPLLVFIIGTSAGFGSLWARRRARNAATANSNGLLVTLWLDRVRMILVDPTGRPLAPLNAVHIHRSFQLFSSSRALKIAFPGGSVIVARGNPFVATVDDMAHALVLRGLRVG